MHNVSHNKVSRFI